MHDSVATSTSPAQQIPDTPQHSSSPHDHAPHAHDHDFRAHGACDNCATAMAGMRFCPECGQRALPHDPSVHDLVHDATHEFLHLDGKIWTTLRLLLVRPGFLTAEFLRGRRARYISPIRLYLTCSLIYFALAASLGESSRSSATSRSASSAPAPGTQERAPADPATARQRSIAQGGSKIRQQAAQLEQDSWFERRMLIASERMEQNPDAYAQALGRYAPRVLFVLVPAFALMVQLCTRRRRTRYPGALYFSVHVHAYAFLALAAATVLDRVVFGSTATKGFQSACLLVVMVHLTYALRRVYDGSWGGSALRSGVITVGYLIMAGLSLMAAALLSLFAV